MYILCSQNPGNKRCEGKVLPRVTSEECKFIKEQDELSLH